MEGRVLARPRRADAEIGAGNPCVVLPNGFTPEGPPVGLSITGGLYGEAETLAVAKSYRRHRLPHQASAAVRLT